MLLLSTSSLKWYWIHKIFILVKKAWYSWIDLVLDKSNFDTIDEKYIKSLSDAFSVPVLSITAYDRWLNKAKIDKIVSMAELLDTQIINFSPPHITDKNMDFYFKYLEKIKKDTRKTIAIQNIEQKFMLFVIPEYKKANLSDIKTVTWDTSLNIENIDRSNWIDLIKAYSILWNSLKNIYINDKNWTKTWLLPWTSGWWISYLPIESFFMKLKSDWYNWFFSLRVNPQELWAWNDEKVLFNLEQFKVYYKKHFLEYKLN